MVSNDFYAECLVEREKPGYAAAVKVLLGAGIILSAVSVMFIGLLGFAAFVLMILTAMYVRGNLNLEYEYLFAENSFSVDRIFNKSKRKQAAEYDLENIEAIGPESCGAIKNLDGRVKKVSDFSSGRSGTKHYALVGRKNGVWEKVIFEPDEKMIKCLKNAAPRKFSEY